MRPSRDEPRDDTFALVRRFQAGDAAAGEELARRYYPRILRIVRVRIWSRLRGWTNPEDVVGEVFTRLLGSLPTFEQRGAARFIDWVASLIEHEIVNQARKMRPVQSLDASESSALRAIEPQAPTTGIATRLAADEEERLVDECLTELPGDEQRVILLREYAGHSWSEIATELGRPSVGATQQLYQRARRALAERLRLRGMDSPSGSAEKE